MWKPDGKLYRAVKKVERWLFRESDAFIILTEKAREILFPESRENGFDKFGRAVEVIPCCVDLKRFESANEASRQKMRQKLGLENRRVITYVGSLTSDWYMPAEIADLFGVAKRQRAETFALILTQSRVEAIRPLLSERGYSENDFLICRVSPAEIPIYLSAADAAVSFIKPCFSKLGSSPTKNAEYLACGLPMITNSGVGDTAEMVREDNVGVVIDEFNTESYEKALAEIEKLLEDKNDLTKRCKNSARKWFDLETVGGKRYLDIYHRLLKDNSDRR
jgi:glycosyltransferase involved in cell wall biosynthesis